MTTLYEKARDILSEARNSLVTLMDVSQVPDSDPVELKMHDAFDLLDEVMDDLPKVAGNAVNLEDEGPIVFPINDRDPRDWPTSEGKVARTAILKDTNLSKKASKKASQSETLEMPKYASPSERRAISRSEFLAALEDASVKTQKSYEPKSRISSSLLASLNLNIGLEMHQ